MERKSLFLPLAILLAFVLLLPLYGCGGGAEEEEPTAGDSAATEEVTMDQLFSKAKDIDGYSYDYVITESESDALSEGKVWLKGSKQRMEMNTEQGQMIQIMDLEAKKAYSYMPEQEMAIELDLSELEAPETPSDYVDNAATENAKYLGTEKINGINCHKYSLEQDGSSVIYWLHDEYGLPVKIETTTDDVVTTMDFNNFKVGDVGDDLFELPSGIQVQSVTDLMQNMPDAP